MNTRAMSRRCMIPFVMMVFAFFLISPYIAWGEGPARITLETTSPQKLSLTVGKSIIIRSTEPVKRVSLGAPEIADALVLTARQISLTGKAPGVTNLTLWGLDNRVSAILDLEVSPDISRLMEMISKILPAEKDVRIIATHDNITLSGTVSSSSNKDQVLALAEPFFPKKVVDLLKVQPSNIDVLHLEEMIRRILPEERDVRVIATQDKVTLAGTVSSKSKSDQVLALAESYFPKKVVNLLQVPAPDVSSISRFKEALHRILPEEKEVKVSATPDSLTLSGAVSSTSNLSQVVAMAQSYLPKDGKVINLLEVGGVHQVMLEVRVAEMSRSLLRRLGFNFNYISSSGRVFGLSLLNNLTSLPSGAGFPGTPVGVTEAINAIFRFLSHGATWTVFIDALKEQGLLKVLAEPTLITQSGKTANFLAGGEFPIPIPQPGAGGVAITVEYKPFGVGLNFTPTVLNNKKLNMQVAPEVSELDFSRAVSIAGFVIPAITTRRVSTVVELADGQSFAIAGLLNEEVRETITKFPVLGEIPIIGALFRSSNFQKNETELVIVVTPHLVKPLDLAKQTLPTDQFIEPDDFEFYLMGKLEGGEKTNSTSPSPKSSSNMTHGLEGNFGHIVPK